jgi:cobalt-zinc-cadmium resistance protein CzcA
VVIPICFLVIVLLLFSTFGLALRASRVHRVPLALTGEWSRSGSAICRLSISAAVGFIALSGVAVLNGLVMITFINQLRGEGVETEHAIISGALTRLRPVS